jgi:ABC-2 type transport system ATP-binding protein
VDLPAIEIKNLTKVYPNVKAVDNISFIINPGEIYGFLGPNGAGKTTIIKMLMTLSKPTEGIINIYGIDARKNPRTVRQIMGYVPQELSVDGDLTGYENLLIYAKLCYVNPKERKMRIMNALSYMGLTDRADDLAKHYSGGMMRRLEIAQALVNQPKILFLDEPSIGLDPSARRQVWQYIKEINQNLKATIFITTHDMIEADELCHRISIIDAGKIVITGSPKELKQTIGEDIITLSLQDAVSLKDSLASLSFPTNIGKIVSTPDNQNFIIHANNGATSLPLILQTFIDAGLKIKSITLSQPTLDDVFLKYTHARLVDSKSFKESRMTRRNFKKHAS